MKVAILLSGQPRNYHKGYEEIKKAYLDRYDCDVFFHTWDDDSFKATQFFHDRPANEYNMEGGWKEELVNLYSPKKHIFEKPIIFDEKNIVDPLWRQPLQNTMGMYYSIYQAFTLTAPGYDCYIRSRFDLMFEPATLELEKLDLNDFHVWNWATDERVKHRGYYDVFGVGSYDAMGIYSTVFSRIPWYLNADQDYRVFLQGGWPGQDSPLRNEYLLRWHLTQGGLNVVEHETTIPNADGQIIR